MDLMTAIIFVILSWIVFAKYPSIAPLSVWVFTGIVMFLNMMDILANGMVYLMFIFLLAILGISAVVEANT